MTKSLLEEVRELPRGAKIRLTTPIRGRSREKNYITSTAFIERVEEGYISINIVFRTFGICTTISDSDISTKVSQIIDKRGRVNLEGKHKVQYQPYGEGSFDYIEE